MTHISSPILLQLDTQEMEKKAEMEGLQGAREVKTKLRRKLLQNWEIVRGALCLF